MTKEELQIQRERLIRPLARLAKKYKEMSANGDTDEGCNLSDTFDTYAALAISITLINKDFDDFEGSNKLS